MKKLLLLILFSIVIIGCQVDYPVVIVPTAAPQPTATPIPVIPAVNPVEFALYDGETLYYYDGSEITEAYSGHIRTAGPRKLSVGNVLNYFDEFGDVVYSKWLSIVPDYIEAVPTISKSETVYQDEIYMIDHIEPEEAYALGGLYKDYAVIYIDGVQQGNWYDNVWNPKDVITTSNGFIIAVDSNSAYHHINGSQNIWKAHDDGFAIYNMNTTNKTATIADEYGSRSDTWNSNWFYNCRWQKADDVWYSSHGFKWSYATGLQEDITIMKIMKDQTLYPVWFYLGYTEYASIVPAGVRQENGEKVLYWIEANRGTLFKQIPSINQLQYVSRIYIGDGTRLYGSNQVFKLKPKWTDDLIYFHHEGNIKKHNPITGSTEIFSEDMELIPWK